MKQAIFLFTLCVLALTSFADDHSNVCTEAANPASYATCMAAQTSCVQTIDACSGLSLCLDLVPSVFEATFALIDFSGVDDCDCMEFTCDENFTVGDMGNSAFVMTAGLSPHLRTTLGEMFVVSDGPLKDTIILQGAGWAFVEVELTNPGIWAIHCHSGQHANAGMMQLLQIGDKFTKTPEDWPTCNSFSSAIDRSDFENLFSEQNKVKFPFVASDNEIEKVMNSDGTISTGDGNCVSVKKAKNGAKVYSTICPTNFDNATFDNATFNHEFHWKFEKDSVNATYGYMKSVAEDKKFCWTVKNVNSASNSNLELTKCRGLEKQRFIIEKGQIWMSYVSEKKQRYCVSVDTENKKVKTRKCYAGFT